MKKVLVLDFPSDFLFPPNGYGGIERWLWSMAKESVELGYEVILGGPLWQSAYLPTAKIFEKRLSTENMNEFMNKYGTADYLVAGHEYWNNAKLRKVFASVADKSLTFQMMPDFKYDGPDDDKNVSKYIQKITQNGGEVNFVELTADRQDLIHRVDNESRKKFKKLTDPEIMSEITQSMDNFTIPFVDALTINTSTYNPIEAVELIVKNLGLV